MKNSRIDYVENFDNSIRRIEGHSLFETVIHEGYEYYIYKFDCYYGDEYVPKYLNGIGKRKGGVYNSEFMNEYMENNYYSKTKYRGLFDDMLVPYFEQNIPNKELHEN